MSNEFFEDLVEPLWSQVGFWSSFAFLFVFLLAGGIAYLIWNKHNLKPSMKELKTDLTLPFVSGNAIDPEAHVGGDNLFWGFTQALKLYYDPVEKAHTGSLNDYAAWFIFVLAIMLIVIVGGV